MFNKYESKFSGNPTNNRRTIVERYESETEPEESRLQASIEKSAKISNSPQLGKVESKRPISLIKVSSPVPTDYGQQDPELDSDEKIDNLLVKRQNLLAHLIGDQNSSSSNSDYDSDQLPPKKEEKISVEALVDNRKKLLNDLVLANGSSAESSDSESD